MLEKVGAVTFHEDDWPGAVEGAGVVADLLEVGPGRLVFRMRLIPVVLSIAVDFKKRGLTKPLFCGILYTSIHAYHLR